MSDQPEAVIHSDPEIMGGTPVFVGTRVPFQTLLDYLEAGDPVERVPRGLSDRDSCAGGRRPRTGQGRPPRQCAFCLTSASRGVSRASCRDTTCVRSQG